MRYSDRRAGLMPGVKDLATARDHVGRDEGPVRALVSNT